MLSRKPINNNTTIGSWITLAHPAIAEIMANAGFDWLAIDLEHSAITIREAEELIRVVELSNVVPLVRLTSNDADLIKRVMDAGAHGIIVPMVNSAEEAELAVRSVRYPPYGARGVGLARAQKYGAGFEKYKKWQSEHSTVIVQIEHIEAVNNLESILSIPGVDGFIVGPYDLTSSMGIPGDFLNPEYLKVMESIKQTAAKIGAPGGVHIIESDVEQLHKCLNEGYKFIAYSLDIRMIDSVCRSAIESIKK